MMQDSAGYRDGFTAGMTFWAMVNIFALTVLAACVQRPAVARPRRRRRAKVIDFQRWREAHQR